MSWKLNSSNLAWKVLYPVKNCPAVFAPRGFLDELLNKFSYPSLGHPMDFIPRNPCCCSFHTPGSFFPPWYPELDTTININRKRTNCNKKSLKLRVYCEKFWEDWPQIVFLRRQQNTQKNKGKQDKHIKSNNCNSDDRRKRKDQKNVYILKDSMDKKLNT